MSRGTNKNIVLLALCLDILLTSCAKKDVEYLKDNKHDYKVYEIDDQKENRKDYIIDKQVFSDILSDIDDIDLETKDYSNIDNNLESKYVPRDLTSDELSLLEKNVFFSGNESNDLISAITEFNNPYDYEELYANTPSIIGKYQSSVKTTSIINNYTINTNLLFTTIKHNNEEYITSNKKFGLPDDKDLLALCNIIANSCSNAILTGKVDIYSLEEKLQDLKFFLYNDFGYGYYNHENNMICLNDITGDVNILIHEVEHLIQAASINEIKESNFEYRTGYCYYVDRDHVNPYNWTWFVEASAESIAANYRDNNETVVYPQELKALNAMKLITFNDSQDLEKTLYSSDIDALYDYFNAKSDSEKENIRKMFYGYTLILNNTPGKEGNVFYRYIKNNYGINMYEDDHNFGNNIKCSVAVSEAKIFYTNLIKNLTNKNVSVSDIFACISLFENELNRELSYHIYYEKYYEGLAKYVNLQMIIFEFLAEKLDIDLDYTLELYYQYNNTASFDCDIQFLNSFQNTLFKNTSDSILYCRREAIIKYVPTLYIDRQNNRPLTLTLN